MSTNASFRAGTKDALVLIPAVGRFGVAFGALAIDAGLAPWLVLLTSVIVVSGAAQFTMVGLLATGAVPVLIATTGLALRHVPMSARLEAPVRGAAAVSEGWRTAPFGEGVPPAMGSEPAVPRTAPATRPEGLGRRRRRRRAARGPAPGTA